MKMYHLIFFLLFLCAFVSPTKDINKTSATNLVFKSTDSGQTWQDISEGLPGNLQEDVVQRDGFFANNSGFYLRAGNEIYHSSPGSTAPFWDKEIFPGKQGSIAPVKNGIFAYNYLYGQFLRKLNGTNVWSPVYTNFWLGL